jgi:hypothetical protein
MATYVVNFLWIESMGKQIRFRLIKFCFVFAKLHEVLGVMFVFLLLISIVWQSNDLVNKAKEWEVNEKMTSLVC